MPCYLLLGEASTGLKLFNQAESYLSLAKWAVLKAVNCDNKLRAQLHHNFGLLYASQQEYEKALQEIAMEVYYHALSNGPEHLSGKPCSLLPHKTLCNWIIHARCLVFIFNNVI